jgi:hypothetical protein
MNYPAPGKQPNIRNVEVIEDNSHGQHIAFVENNMYIDPTRDMEEIEFWKNRLRMQKIPYIMASVEHHTKDVVTNRHYVRKGKTLFTGEALTDG